MASPSHPNTDTSGSHVNPALVCCHAAVQCRVFNSGPGNGYGASAAQKSALRWYRWQEGWVAHRDVMGRGQARIQDFAQGGATNRGPEARGPKVPLSKKQKVCGVVHFFSWGPFTILFSYFYHLFFFYRSGRGLGPRDPPPLRYVPGRGRVVS